MDPVQIVVIFISLTVTTLIVVLGVQVYYILGEIRNALVKVNQMLDDGVKVSGTVSDTVESTTGVIKGIAAGLSFLSRFSKRRQHNDE